MHRRTAAFFSSLALVASSCAGQNPFHSVEIQLPPSVVSETFFARYVLTGQDFGGWVQPRAGVSSYIVDTGHAIGIKAILYAPGCAIQTVDLALSEAANRHYSFVCQPLGSTPIAGALLYPARFYQPGTKLQAKYIARWAQRFLTLDDTIVTSIPVGDAASLTPDGHFELNIPDFSQDALAGSADHPGEIQIWAKDKSNEVILAQLIAAGPRRLKTRMGGLRVQSAYPAETIFTLCGTTSFSLTARDKFGFATRAADDNGGCDR